VIGDWGRPAGRSDIAFFTNFRVVPRHLNNLSINRLDRIIR
jgi:hypothetical protein